MRTTLAPVLHRLRRQDGQSPTPEEIFDLKVCDPAMGSAAFLVEACRQLGDALIDAWGIHGGRPEIPADEDEVILARRLVAQRCLYGLDRNPVAADLAKMSLWLATLASDHALTFLDHALRTGDALVGLSRRQIQAFHWDDKKPPLAPIRIAKHMERVVELREEIRAAGEDVSDFARRDMWDEAQAELDEVRLFGDLATLAHFSGAKPKDREAKRAEFVAAVTNGNAGQHRWLSEQARETDPPVAPFHWGIEFPEVFQRDNPGFDAFVGNPPFAGKNTLLSSNPDGYLDWLKHIHEGAHGNADLVAHFFRRAFGLLRGGGALGLIATNTIRQGDTRSTGLRWICTNGGEIYEARRRLKWPGLAAVVVTVVHAIKGEWTRPRLLDGRETDTITAFLFHAGGNDDPATLAANAGKSFVGSYVLGMGFTFDDTDKKGVATPIADMHRLIEARSENAAAIFPYLGGEEVNTSPTQSAHRYVINFGDRTEEECWSRWPELMAIVEQKVKPSRMKDNRESYRRYWWQYAEKRSEMQSAVSGLHRAIVISRVGQRVSFAFVPTENVFSEGLVVFPLSRWSALAALQSRPHEAWARFFASSMKDDLRYSPSDCFETFPLPERWADDVALEEAGKAYDEFRSTLLIKTDDGLTKTYNRFHDPDERSADILKLRELHTEMDRAVLDAYGWADIPTDCEFLLDYEVDDDGTGRRRKPWRYRWPGDVHDEVLARLLALNAERAAEEQRSGAAAVAAPTKKPAAAAKAAPHAEGLF